MTDVLWTAQDVAIVTNGTVQGGDVPIQGISIDTRDIKPGDLFIALKGPRFDGHEFVNQAMESGAAYVMVDHGHAGRQITVHDTFQALQDLGEGARERTQAKIFAITGSVGKTTTKEILARMLSALGKTHAAEASLNNHWGVPLSLARMPQDTDFAVFEIGMNHAGEISPLSKMVSPHVAIITTISTAHIEYLKTIENIALAKAEIFDGLDADGIVLLPRDSEQYPLLLAEARTQGLRNIKTFGLHPESDFRLLDIKFEGEKSKVEALIQGETIHFTLGIPGAHQALNALAVIGALHALKLDIHQALPVLATLKPVSGRGNRFTIQLEQDRATVLVIDETHNASPVAVEAALRVLANIPTTGRRLAILGDMLELGQESPDYHAALAKTILDCGVDMTLTCGKLMAHLAEAMPFGKNRHFADSKTLAEQIRELIQPGDVILIKGSRGAQMRLIVDALKQFGQVEQSEPSKILSSA